MLWGGEGQVPARWRWHLVCIVHFLNVRCQGRRKFCLVHYGTVRIMTPTIYNVLQCVYTQYTVRGGTEVRRVRRIVYARCEFDLFSGRYSASEAAWLRDNIYVRALARKTTRRQCI